MVKLKVKKYVQVVGLRDLKKLDLRAYVSFKESEKADPLTEFGYSGKGYRFGKISKTGGWDLLGPQGATPVAYNPRNGEWVFYEYASPATLRAIGFEKNTDYKP